MGAVERNSDENGRSRLIVTEFCACYGERDAQDPGGGGGACPRAHWLVVNPKRGTAPPAAQHTCDEST